MISCESQYFIALVAAKIEECHTRVMVRNHIIVRCPGINMDMLELGRSALSNGRADIHVVEGLGVHVIGAVFLLAGNY